MRRRAVLLTLALVSLALGPVLYAAATPGGRDAAGPPSLTGTLTKVDLRHHDVAVKVTKGAAKYRGRTVTLIVTSSPPGATSVTRLGHKAKLASIKKGDRVVLTYRLNAHKQLVAIHVIDSGPAPVSHPSPTLSPMSSTSSATPSPTPTTTTATSASSVPPPPPTSSIPTGAYVIHMADYAYTLPSGDALVGQTVAVVSDGGTHTWTSGDGTTGTSNGIFDSGDVFTDANYQYVFSTAGTYTFFCKHHYALGMKGSITVDAMP